MHDKMKRALFPGARLKFLQRSLTLVHRALDEGHHNRQHGTADAAARHILDDRANVQAACRCRISRHRAATKYHIKKLAAAQSTNGTRNCVTQSTETLVRHCLARRVAADGTDDELDKKRSNVHFGSPFVDDHWLAASAQI